MRVKIEHAEVTTGWLFRRVLHEVHLTADFTHEEKQIIRQRGLTGQVLMERAPPDMKVDDDPGWYALRVGHLFDRRPDRHRCANPSAAKAYARELGEVMAALKAWLDDNADPGETIVVEF